MLSLSKRHVHSNFPKIRTSTPRFSAKKPHLPFLAYFFRSLLGNSVFLAGKLDDLSVSSGFLFGGDPVNPFTIIDQRHVLIVGTYRPVVTILLCAAAFGLCAGPAFNYSQCPQFPAP